MRKNTVEIKGTEDILRILDRVGKKHARNLIRSTVHGIATEIKNHARKIVKKDKRVLERSITVKRRRSKSATSARSDVIITKGRSARYDGFYWRFVEYGTSGLTSQPARPFIGPAAEYQRSIFVETLKTQFGKKLEAAARREAKRNAKT